MAERRPVGAGCGGPGGGPHRGGPDQRSPAPNRRRPAHPGSPTTRRRRWQAPAPAATALREPSGPRRRGQESPAPGTSAPSGSLTANAGRVSRSKTRVWVEPERGAAVEPGAAGDLGVIVDFRNARDQRRAARRTPSPPRCRRGSIAFSSPSRLSDLLALDRDVGPCADTEHLSQLSAPVKQVSS